MSARLLALVQALIVGAALALASIGLPRTAMAQAHEFKCDTRSGIDRARCERHEKMYVRCGPLEGEAHFVCDREFLLANPLDCSALTGEDASRCEAEVKAFKACQAQPGRAFMRCVRDAIRASPMGAS